MEHCWYSGYGISLNSSSGNTFSNNNASNNTVGIYLDYSSSNTIYNNYFNNTVNTYENGNNIWNTTKTSGTNIVGGSYLAGNFWAYPNGTGFSQTCSDVNHDGICDEPYILDANNKDYLPLSLDMASNGRVHNINKNTNYATIQAAINDASPGNEIHVNNGTYFENVNVNKRLILRGIGMPVVNAGGNGSAITLAADGITLEGFTATGAGDSIYYSPNAGIMVTSNNNTLTGNNASNNMGGSDCGNYFNCNSMGIYLRGSNNNRLIDNNANSNTDSGIYLGVDLGGNMSRDNMLIGNKATYNRIGIDVNSIWYRPGGTSLLFEANNTLNNNIVSNNDDGISLFSKKNTLTGNNASNNTNSGISIDTHLNGFVGYGENTLSNNTVSNNGYGIYLQSINNTLKGNKVSNNNDSGIYIYTYIPEFAIVGNGSNTLNYNSISNNGNGVYIESSKVNTVMGNNILNNDKGIILNNSDSNLIYNNNFSNINNANDNGSNIWNTTKTSGTNIVGGSYLGGNFWAYPNGTGFSQTCSDVNHDGICDEPYVLAGNNKDYLPLSLDMAGNGRVHNINKSTYYTTIQAAINDANPGNEIHVNNGTYFENVNVTKRLILRGIGMPVVDARGNGTTITLASDGIILEGFTATGAGSYPEAGIKILSNNNKLSGNNALNNGYYGIILSFSRNNTLSGNNASNNYDGIDLGFSNNNTLSGNNASNKGYGIYLHYSSNNTLISNNASDTGVHGIYLDSSSYNTLISNNASDTGLYGINVDYSSNNTLSGNNASNNKYGIILSYSSNNTLSGNNASNNQVGIILYYSSSNTLISNNAANNGGVGYGIHLFVSNNNTLSGNNASNNGYYGIYLDSVNEGNKLSGNNASNNGYYGISLRYSSKNTIYNNYFSNTNNANDDGSNIWNTTKTSGTNIVGGSYLAGNFWAYPNGTGFSQTCSDVNHDGICDEPYVLDGNNKDYLPLSLDMAGNGRVHNINKNTYYTTIQAAINDASAGNEIHVNNGTYFENVNVTKRLILRGIGMPVVDAGINLRAIHWSSVKDLKMLY